MQPTDILTIQAIAKREAARAVKDAADTSLAAMAITIKGEAGRDGIDGKDGINGKDGKDGKDGVDGHDGRDGVDGRDGDDGDLGAQGIPGKDGVNGRDGVSIRDVYVDPDDGDLYVELTNSRLINAGHVKGEDGKPGKDGRNGIMVGGGGASSTATGGGDMTSGAGIVIVGSEVRMSIGTLPLAG